jgi:hypothetical protein
VVRVADVTTLSCGFWNLVGSKRSGRRRNDMPSTIRSA